MHGPWASGRNSSAQGCFLTELQKELQMTDTDRLAALLHENLIGCGFDPTASPTDDPAQSRYHLNAADRLIAAGVTLAPTPPDALREAAQAVVDAADRVGPFHEQDGGLRDALRALRAALSDPATSTDKP
jgi:hypothetical protein